MPPENSTTARLPKGPETRGAAGYYPLVSLIVPALNEAPSLDELYRRAKQVLDGIGQKFEFILVDDGSTDDTADVAGSLCDKYDNVLIVRHHRKHGKSMALMQGFDIATGDVAVTMDADLQDLPEMLPRFFDKLEEGYDLVIGWRVARKDTGMKRFLSSIYNHLTANLLDCPVHDINCGIKAMRKQVYKNLDLRGDLHRMIPALVSPLGYKVTEVPVDHADRRHGTSKYRLYRHRGLLDIVAVIAARATQWRPLHVFFEVSLLFWGLAVLAVVTWIIIGIASPQDGLLASVLRPILGLMAVWAVFTGTLLPIFGLYLELVTSHYQDAASRRRLIKNITRSEK